MTFELLGIDVSRIIELRDLLDMMDISRLNKENIGAEIQIAGYQSLWQTDKFCSPVLPIVRIFLDT
jgi:hypothetical protein